MKAVIYPVHCSHVTKNLKFCMALLKHVEQYFFATKSICQWHIIEYKKINFSHTTDVLLASMSVKRKRK